MAQWTGLTFSVLANLFDLRLATFNVKFVLKRSLKKLLPLTHISELQGAMPEINSNSHILGANPVWIACNQLSQYGKLKRYPVKPR